MIFIIRYFILLTLINYVYAFLSINNLRLRNQVNVFSNLPVISTDMEQTTHTHFIQNLRDWYIKNFKYRPDDVFIRNAMNSVDLLSDIWKSIIIANNIQENDNNLQSYIHLSVFPNSKLDVMEFVNIIEELKLQFNVSKPMFKSYNHQFNILQFNQSIPVLVIHSTKADPIISLSDWDEKYETMNDNSLPNNNIKSFPFPNIFEFIAEINRPIDLTSQSLKKVYHLKVKDLKYDLKKLSKKYNPQEFVDTMNCRLNRLCYWKSILKEYKLEQSHLIFQSDYDFLISTKQKYQFLKSQIQINPKYVLESQYDQVLVYTDFIDSWITRLLGNFKHAYQRYFKDIQQQQKDLHVSESSLQWKGSLENIHKMIRKIPILDYEFELNPFNDDSIQMENSALLIDTSYVFMNNDFNEKSVISEMLLWVDRITKSILFAYNRDRSKILFDSIEAYVCIKSSSIENILFHSFSSIHQWLESSNEEFKRPIDIKHVLKRSLNDETLTGFQNKKYFQFLRELNTFSRNQSNLMKSNVKSMYLTLSQNTEHGINWFYELVKDLDLSEEIEEFYLVMKNRKQSNHDTNIPLIEWYKLISSVIHTMLPIDPSESQNQANDLKRYIDSLQSIQSRKVSDNSNTDVSSNIDQWEKFKSIFQQVDDLSSIIQYSTHTKESIRYEQENQLNQIYNVIEHHAMDSKQNIEDLINTKDDNSMNISTKSLLIVIPRYFRGIGSNQELQIFLTLAEMIKRQVQSTGVSNFTITPLHPLMVLEDGMVDLRHRSPHPAILLTISK